ncbi:unnamed protein product [Cunninghamella echinulata]
MLILYGILLLANSYLSQKYFHTGDFGDIKMYWFCTTYNFITSSLQVAASGCCIRLLCHLIHIIDTIKLNQQQKQQQLYSIEFPLPPTTIDPNYPHDSIRTTNSTLLHFHLDHYLVSSTTTALYQKKGCFYFILSSFLFWCHDHQRILWDILFSWILPLVYSVLLFAFEAYRTDTFFLEYSPSFGCLPRFYQSKIAATIYYIYPFLLMIIGCFCSVELCIKLFTQRKRISEFKSLKKGIFFKLIIFCGLYNIFNFIHLPNIITGYMSYVLNQKLPWSIKELSFDENGLCLSVETSLEMITFFGYPLLNLIWILFFGTTKEALLLYHSIWDWIINIKNGTYYYLFSSSPLQKTTSLLPLSSSNTIEDSSSHHTSFSSHTSPVTLINSINNN